ncbi:MAG: phosphatase [Candidatus Xenobiia bacterium LiM19]
MNKTFRYISSLLFIIVCSLGALHANSDTIRLVIDPRMGSDIDLSSFRRFQDKFINSADKVPSREGLSSLRISGSSQFSEAGLKMIKDRLRGEKIMIVDLRQESHGLMNGIPISWMDKHNAANKGKSLNEITSDESSRLKDLLSLKKVTVERLPAKDGGAASIEDTVYVKTTCSEQEACRASAVDYIRFPVTDDSRPDEETVNGFITFFKSRPAGIWLHFHCKDGHGRTTTFMAMCDMLENAKKVSFDDIIARQYCLGGANLSDSVSPDNWRYPLESERTAFLKEFYQRCRRSEKQ